MEAGSSGNVTPKKSILKKPKPPPGYDSDHSDVIFSHSDSSSEEDSNSADDLPKEYVYYEHGSPCADYRRLFSMSAEERAKWRARKQELGQFFPPKKPDANAAKQRYQHSENLFKRLGELAWKDSASAIQNYKYDVMRKKINVDAIREKYNRKKPLPEGHRSRCNTPLARKRRRKSNQAHPTPPEDDSNQPSPETEAERRLQEEYLASLPSTSLAKTTPAFVKKSLQKKAKVNAPHTIHEEQIKSENRQFSYLDATIEDEAYRRKNAGKQKKFKKKA